MNTFPSQFSEILTPDGLRILHGEAESSHSAFSKSKQGLVMLRNALDRRKAEACINLLDRHLYELMRVAQSRIPSDSITGMQYNYSEALPKVMRFKSAVLQRKTARCYQAAERIGLVGMMRSESFVSFAEAITGLRLDPDLGIQAICYRHGDYVGPHNDHHPEDESLRKGYVDVHVAFVNDAVSQQFLIYEDRRHLSNVVDLSVRESVTVYKLPFWHYTTPLAAKSGRESEARRWLLIGSFRIL